LRFQISASFLISRYDLSPAYFLCSSRQSYLMRHPVKIAGQEDKVPVLSRIVPTVHNSQISLTASSVQIPGLFSMIRDIRITQSLVVGSPWFCLHMKKRILLPESNCLFYKIQKLSVLFHASPVYPADLI